MIQLIPGYPVCASYNNSMLVLMEGVQEAPLYEEILLVDQFAKISKLWVVEVMACQIYQLSQDYLQDLKVASHQELADKLSVEKKTTVLSDVTIYTLSFEHPEKEIVENQGYDFDELSEGGFGNVFVD